MDVRAPPVPCRITASCPVNPSEDEERVVRAVSNVLPGAGVAVANFSVTAESGSLSCLEHVVESVRARRTAGAYRRRLERNADGPSTWMYLNKQAAFAGRVAICDDAGESPLGPIRLAVSSPRLAEIIDWVGGRS